MRGGGGDDSDRGSLIYAGDVGGENGGDTGGRATHM